MRRVDRLWIGIIVLIILSPIGIMLPAKFHAGSAWGEWDAGEIKSRIGYVPQGMQKTADRWSAPMPDYALKGQNEATMRARSASYILSGIAGTAAIIIISFAAGKILARHERSDSA